MTPTIDHGRVHLFRLIGAVSLAGAAIHGASGALAQNGDDARAILKAMSDYVSAQQSIAATFSTDIEVLTSDLQKIEFDSSGGLQLSRPDKIHASRTGGYSDVELVFDGKTFTIENKKDNVFAQADAPGTVDQLVDKIRSELGVDLPGADLFLSNPYDVLNADVIEAKHIGRGIVNGVECEHLAFRNDDTDWQIWVATGAQPIPCKFVITSKAVTGGPEYTMLITDWKSNATIPPDAFTFKPPAGAKKVEFKDLVDVDEVPPGTVKGGKP